MSQRVAVSVIVPVRNGAAHLGAALRSVISQEPVPDQVIVVDGGSVDHSVSIAQGVPGVEVIAQSGLGLGAARNQGITAARHDLLAFCDSDDRWSPDSLQTRLAPMQQDPLCGAVIGHYRTVELPGETIPARRREAPAVPKPGYTPGALLVHRSTFARVGSFDETLRIGTDTDWFVRLSESEVPWSLVTPVVLLKGARLNSLSDDVRAYRPELLAIARNYTRRRRERKGENWDPNQTS